MTTSSSSGNIGQWGDLIAFEPSAALTMELSRRGYLPRPISTGEAEAVNLDDFAVRVPRLPEAAGSRLTPEELLAHIRANLNDFVDDGLARFRPQAEDVDGPRWRSSRPHGAVVVVDLKIWKLTNAAPLVCSEAASDHWRFTTLGLTVGDAWRTGQTVPLTERARRVVGKTHALMSLADSHPVSGTREFGVRRCEDGIVEIYTRGADAVTDLGYSMLSSALGAAGGPASSIYAKGQEIWTSFQEKTAQFVNRNGGEASVVAPCVLHPEFGAIRSLLVT